MCDANFRCLTHLNPHMFNLYVGSPQLHNLYSVAGACICISFRAEQWKVCTKLTVFISHLDTCSSYQHPLSSVYWWIRKRWKNKNCGLSCFLLCHHFQHKWLANTGNPCRGYDGFLPHPCFLESRRLLTMFEASGGFHRSAACPGFQCVRFSVVNVTETLPLAELPHVGASEQSSGGTGRKGETRMGQVSSAHHQIPVSSWTSLIKYKLKDAVIKCHVAAADH